MGIIRKQAVSGTVYTYLGAVIGFVNVGLVFPKILATEEIGLLNMLISYSLIFAQFGGLGFNSVTSRLFPYFRNQEKGHNGFIFIAFLVLSIGFLLSLGGFYIFAKVSLPDKVIESPLLAEYFWYALPLIFFTILFQFFDAYSRVLFNATRGIFFKEVFIRAVILISIGLYYFTYIDYKQFVMLYVVANSLPACIMFFQLVAEKQIQLKPQLNFISKDLKKNIIGVAFFGILVGATGIITLNVDKLMIESLLDENGLGMVGVYSTAFFFGTIIIMPSRALNKISATVIAEAFKENDISSISDLYKKTAINQFIVGILLLAGIWVNIDNIFKILSEDFYEGRYVILFIGLAYLSDMAGGAAIPILSLSKYYKLQSVFMLVMTVFIIITNLIFIPIWGIVGAAFASFLSKLLINIVRFWYLKHKLNLQPYNAKFLLVGTIAVVAYLAGYIIPDIDNIVISIAMKSIPVAAVFYVLIILSKPSDDITEFNRIILKKLHILK